jgi:Fic family protein
MFLEWRPIEDLPDNWAEMRDSNLHALSGIWNEIADELQQNSAYSIYLTKLKRRLAIETGIIERLYDIDRGRTEILIDEGINAAFLPHGASDKPASQIIPMIQDHEAAIEGIFEFVRGQRSLSTSYIKELHAVLTRHQATSEAVDQFGQRFNAKLLRGEWKQHPNSPTRPDGTLHQYSPPEQVAPQMEQLIQWHLEHQQKEVPPEIEAAWLHHRFAQIHPFQDGNGRVARMLASLIFIRAHWFPLVVTRDHTAKYIEALEQADQGELSPLVDLFSNAQRKEFRKSIGLAEETITEKNSLDQSLADLARRVKKSGIVHDQNAQDKAEQYTIRLFNIARENLETLRRSIEQSIKPLSKNLEVFVDFATPDDGVKAGYYYQQIIEAARKYEYFANVQAYKSWVNLTVKINGIQIGYLLSFHGLGHSPRGVMICSACAYQKVPDEGKEALMPTNIETLADAPFNIPYSQEIEDLESRFTKWLQSTSMLAIEYLRQRL